LQNVKDKHADQPAKKDVRHAYSRIASVEPPWLETTRFQKCVYMQGVLYSAIERLM